MFKCCKDNKESNLTDILSKFSLAIENTYMKFWQMKKVSYYIARVLKGVLK